jgi:hypothetical protein
VSSSQIVPLTLVGPGFFGLNTQASATLLGPEWASEALNIVYDDTGRPSARNGWAILTGTPISGTPAIRQLFEYVPITGSTHIISSTSSNIYSGTTTLTSRTGVLTPSAGNWKFVNFNGSVYGLQTGHPLISWNGTGNFAAVTAATGTVPDGNCLLSAFGRLWGSSADGQTLKYCSLLDATNWSTIGAGSINFTNVWSTGQDTIQALGAFNNYLVVFGRDNIILIEDNSGSTIGLDPQNARVADVITGIGCIARDSVQVVEGDDLVFLSATGVYGVRRIIQEGGNILRGISKNVRDLLVYHAKNSVVADIKSAYIPKRGLYLLLMPTVNAIYAFSTKTILPDGAWRVTLWDGFMPTSLATTTDQNTLYAGKSGAVYNHTGYIDVAATYKLVYTSPWTVVSEEVKDHLKTLKRLGAILTSSGLATVTFKWGFDFRANFSSAQRTTVNLGPGAEYGIAEYGIAEYGSTQSMHELEVPGSGTGQFVRVGIECNIENFTFALQQMQLFAKISRMT